MGAPIAHAATSTWTFTVSGVTRTAIVYAPDTAATTPTPVVFCFHGHNGTASGIKSQMPFDTKWPAAISVYPQGLTGVKTTQDPDGLQTGWQFYSYDQSGRDLAFFDQILSRLKTTYNVKNDRIYCTGFSNGAYFTYLLWQQRGSVFAALAPCSGNCYFPTTLTPRPAIIQGGDNDTVVSTSSQASSMANIRTLNGCSSTSTVWNTVGKKYASTPAGNPEVTYVFSGGHQLVSLETDFIIDFFRDTYTTIDDFQDNDATGWQTYGGAWTAASGVYSVTSGPGYKAILSDIASDDYTIEADVTASAGNAGIIFRANNYSVGTDAYQGYYAGIAPGAGVIAGKADNNWTQLSSAAMTITAGASYHLKVVALGTSLQVYVTDMDTPKISIVDATYTSGAVGLRSYNSASTFDNFTVNAIHAETESLTVAATSGDTHRIFAGSGFSGGFGTILDATAVGDYVTYVVPNIAPGTYSVRVGVKKAATRGIFQLAIGIAGSTTPTNIGSAQDLYSAADAYTELNIGTWTPGSTSDKWFKFSITGKNASSTGFTEAFDYIRIIPQ